MNSSELWHRYCQHHYTSEKLGLSLDISRMNFDDGFFNITASAIARAFCQMDELEQGAVANPDEKRMVGHYWLRQPSLAPDPGISKEIHNCVVRIKNFAADIHSGGIAPPSGGKFKNLLLIGVGGSALGPQFIDDALRHHNAPMKLYFCDNTDPDGFDQAITQIGSELPHTLVAVISKSGGTKETRNGMLEAMHAYEAAGLEFSKHAILTTGVESPLEQMAKEQKWLAIFPMWDWVGGRTSQMSAVGLLPAALQGIDIDELLAGAAAMDTATREHDVRKNPAALMALMWYDAAKNRGLRCMAVIPYKDRLVYLSRYLQQLVMESLGKELDLSGNTVHEGLTVYGNKGSSDQHAYVQQLREGHHDFFVTLIEVLNDRDGESIEVEPNVTSGDYLLGFLLGTRDALYQKNRESMTVTVNEVTPRSVGALIALFERTVGLFASLVNINAYHQPGVEAGKRAAGEVIALQEKIVKILSDNRNREMTAEQIAAVAGLPERVEWTYILLRHWVANGRFGVKQASDGSPETASFLAVKD